MTELEKVLNRGKDGSKGKSILIINTPETCVDCPIHEYHGGEKGWVRDDDT